MGTRSVIARPLSRGGKAGWEGTYCHWDGYPTAQLKALRWIVTEHFAGDANAAIEAVLSRQWSSLGDTRGREGENNPSMDLLPYGFAYKDESNDTAERLPIQSSDDDLSGLEWLYVLRPESVEVWQDCELKVATVRWDQPLTEEQYTLIECGEHWERCQHMARSHDKAVPRDSPLSMREWVGLENHVRLRNAVAIQRGKGRRYLSGSMSQHYGRYEVWLRGKSSEKLLLARECGNDTFRTAVPIWIDASKTVPEQLIPAGTQLPY